MKYKIGDRVRIKSSDWYSENKDKRGFICFVYANFTPEMSRYCGEILTINQVVEEYGQYRMSEYGFAWTDEMIEGCVESIEDRMKELRKMCTISLTDNNYTDKIEVLLNDYEYIEENGKAYFVKKKKEYPKTFLECCDVLNIGNLIERGVKGYKAELFDTLQKLLICRDAYWKIAGEEMGLEKPWKPDWTNEEWPDMAYISYDGKSIDKENGFPCCNMILIFPTEEMRDAFYENFKELIEQCKELL